jgi:TolA-binding protein
VLLIVEAARVPALTGRISRMEHTAQRLDTLERSLSELQKRYDQVRTMMGGDAPTAGEQGASAAPGFTPAPAVFTRAHGSNPVRATTRAATATEVPSEPGSASARGAAPETAAEAAANEPSADSGGAVTPAATPRRARARSGAASPQTVVVPPPPDSGAPPSPQAEPQ